MLKTTYLAILAALVLGKPTFATYCDGGHDPVTPTPITPSLPPSDGDGGNSTTKCFPSGFMFGTATSAFQVEGGVNATGRTPSFWDAMCKSGSGLQCANVADDFVHRYKSDIQLLKADGYGAFRLSISWTRAMTWNNATGHMEANPEGLAYYHSVIDELLANRIEPVVTVFHWDVPLALYQLGDFLQASIIDHFVEYSDLVYREFGQKVKRWATINEPLSYMAILYTRSASDSDEYEAAHNLILAHAASVQRFRELQAGGTVLKDAQIGLVVDSFGIPMNASDPADVEAAERYNQFEVGWWMSPLATGDYPAVMRERVGSRLPTFTEQQAAVVKGSYDLLMFNFYGSSLITDCASASSQTNCSTLSAGHHADMGVDSSQFPPEAVRASGSTCSSRFGYAPSYLTAIEWLHKQDPNTGILLTENGWCGNATIDNQDQVWYYRTHLQQVHKAIHEEKIPIVGYLAWSFLDNYEWGQYDARYGLYHVDFPVNIGSPDLYTVPETSLTRTPRSAAKFMRTVATTGCVEVKPEDTKWL
ncbi:hypothetical protein Poli38472_005154 [Pythium oligandrum]|uniref:Beta-glucosidase n=1 Tax=Pythium oligandrum TaxID=41045 RepID=A0A8K1FHB4_PYTOL|nr:hypothetical protein Poli38472_005154 [Pythium oligandrum]|eukprot:TMW62536.1 hypothetical protein Poli38472_005154 [Pythium oligandrum]